MSEFGVKKGLLIAKVPTKKMGDPVWLKSILRTYRVEASFTSGEGGMEGARGDSWPQTSGHQHSRGRAGNFLVLGLYFYPHLRICLLILFYFLKIFHLFLERGERRDKEKEKNISVWLPLTCPLLGTWPETQACALTGNRIGDPLLCRLVLSPLSHTSQGLLIDCREEGNQRERETPTREKHLSVASYKCPDWKSNSPPSGGQNDTPTICSYSFDSRWCESSQEIPANLW